MVALVATPSWRFSWGIYAIAHGPSLGHEAIRTLALLVAVPFDPPELPDLPRHGSCQRQRLVPFASTSLAFQKTMTELGWGRCWMSHAPCCIRSMTRYALRRYRTGTSSSADPPSAWYFPWIRPLMPRRANRPNGFRSSSLTAAGTSRCWRRCRHRSRSLSCFRVSSLRCSIRPTGRAIPGALRHLLRRQARIPQETRIWCCVRSANSIARHPDALLVTMAQPLARPLSTWRAIRVPAPALRAGGAHRCHGLGHGERHSGRCRDRSRRGAAASKMPALLREMRCGTVPQSLRMRNQSRCHGMPPCGAPAILSANTGHLDLIDAQCAAMALTRQKPHRSSDARCIGGSEGWGESDVEEILAGARGRL